MGQQYLGHQLVKIKNSGCQHKGYLLKCLRILSKFEYDFVGNKDEKGNNILHQAVLFGDGAIIPEMLIIYRENTESLKSLLNDKNADGRMPFHIAMDLCLCEIAGVLLDLPEQYIDFEPFLHKTATSDSQWIQCFGQMLSKLDESKDQ